MNTDILTGRKILAERDSKVSGKIRVVKDFAWGVHIQANGLTQSGGVVEGIWRSTIRKISHYPLTIKRCLILGLGGGTVAKLLRRFWPKAEIVGVDIDPVMVELGTRYMELAESKTKIIISDAYDFDSTGYDLVIVDLYKADKFPKKFGDERFLKKLTQNKLVVFNRLYFRENRPEAMKFGKKLEKIFPKVEYFYPEANLMFICQ